jgi:hypothetical protein
VQKKLGRPKDSALSTASLLVQEEAAAILNSDTPLETDGETSNFFGVDPSTVAETMVGAIVKVAGNETELFLLGPRKWTLAVVANRLEDLLGYDAQ